MLSHWVTLAALGVSALAAPSAPPAAPYDGLYIVNSDGTKVPHDNTTTTVEKRGQSITAYIYTANCQGESFTWQNVQQNVCYEYWKDNKRWNMYSAHTPGQCNGQLRQYECRHDGNKVLGSFWPNGCANAQGAPFQSFVVGWPCI